MVTLKALPSAGTLMIRRDDSNATTQNIILTNHEAYQTAFGILQMLGMVREAGPDSNSIIVITLTPPTTDDEYQLLDPTHQVVPSLETLLHQVNRYTVEHLPTE